MLCSRDSQVLHEFSRRCMDILKERSLLGMPLPFLRTYLQANIQKEIDKDRLIIEFAAARHGEGRACCDFDVEEMFEMTKQVDRSFLRKVAVPSLSIQVRYDEIAAIRKARIDCIARTVHDLLAHWPDGAAMEDAVRASFGSAEFRGVVREFLHLYNLETRRLSGSIRLFGPLQMAADAFTGSLFRIMEEVSAVLTEEYVRDIYGQKAIA